MTYRSHTEHGQHAAAQALAVAERLLRFPFHEATRANEARKADILGEDEYLRLKRGCVHPTAGSAVRECSGCVEKRLRAEGNWSGRQPAHALGCCEHGLDYPHQHCTSSGWKP